MVSRPNNQVQVPVARSRVGEGGEGDMVVESKITPTEGGRSIIGQEGEM